MTSKVETNTYRTTATVVGVVYLAGFVVGIGGEVLIQSVLATPNHLATVSANSIMLAIGAVLWLMAVAGDAAHGILMFPILKPHSERIAIGYLGARIMDAVFIAVMVLFLKDSRTRGPKPPGGVGRSEYSGHAFRLRPEFVKFGVARKFEFGKR